MTTIKQVYKVEKANAVKTHKAAVKAEKIAKKEMIRAEEAQDKTSEIYHASGRKEGKALQAWQAACAQMRLKPNVANTAKVIKAEKAYREAAREMQVAWVNHKLALGVYLKACEVSKKADWYENDCYNEMDCLIHNSRFA
jgi:hypothetical protein